MVAIMQRREHLWPWVSRVSSFVHNHRGSTGTSIDTAWAQHGHSTGTVYAQHGHSMAATPTCGAHLAERKQAAVNRRPDCLVLEIEPLRARQVDERDSRRVRPKHLRPRACACVRGCAWVCVGGCV
eukprot:3201237-Prymnesium_polylepis.2